MARAIRQGPGGILSWFTRHRTAANLVMVVMVVLGLAAIPNMRAQFFPDVVIQEVIISVEWDGAGASDIDAAIIQVLEPEMLAIEGVESTRGSSVESWGTIFIEFQPGWDMSRAATDVQAAVDAITTLPDAAEKPEVRRGTWYDRVTDVVITGPVGVDQLALYADELVTRLFAEGVTRTSLRGVAAPQIIVEVPGVQLMAHDITLTEIAAAIAAEVDADPAGDVDGAATRVRTGQEKRDPDQIAAIILRDGPDLTRLTVGDIAQLRVLGAARERAYFVGENPAISVRVDRSEGGDAIGIQKTVEQVARDMARTLPEGVNVDLIRTRSEQISGRLTTLLDNAATGLMLVVALLFLFLNARTAFWVAAGIPVALLAAVALMYAAGITINMISLFALIITLGIVVDDAIVVGEHADARVRSLGESPVVAAENAARRMAMPVFSATATTIIAFAGLTAIAGRFGDLIADIPFTVIVVLTASLIECFLILPHHMSHALSASNRAHWYDAPSRTVNRGFEWMREAIFRPLMAGVIWLRYPVLAGAVLILASQVALFVQGDVTWRFFNAPERGSVTGNFAMAPSATRADSLEMLREMQRAAQELAAEYEAEHGRNPLDYVIAEIGGNAGRGLTGTDTKEPDQLGAISIELIEADLRPYSSFAFAAALQERIVQHPLAETVSFRGWRSGPGGDALDVQFYGADAPTLKAASQALKEALLAFPEISGVEDDLAYDKEELVLDLTPQGAALGFGIDTLGRELRARLNGIEAATYPVGPRSAEVRVELPEGSLTADFLERTQLRTPGGAYVPLADIVSAERRDGFSTVRRENGVRLISVTGEISEDDPARASEIQNLLSTDILPRIGSELQVDWRMSGLAEQENDFLNDALLGLMLTLVGIYLVLSLVFGSWTRPVVVMAIIPFGLVGTIYGHHVWDVPMSMFTVVGLLGMTGIIINDSIVLVTTIDEYAETRGLIPSIIDGAADRLRPVMLTTLTTVLGLTPLLFERSQQAQFLKPTVITLVYGLGFGMVLVLLVVPALMAVQHDVARQMAALRRGLRFRTGSVRRAMLGGVAAIGVWFTATMGAAMWAGALPGFVTALMPMTAGMDPVVGGLLAFLMGAAALVLVLYASLAIAQALHRPSRRGSP
ncbi:efflux RND transporter permease subunit [Roseovarius arcticus]|uniref:efflux RND transporter permease subunit n=1 Tax=Roseovarius arcticus TaxID=2547404 RepID=UPI001110D5D1|nr:efflux RND transporter permease subunit [Roseovarius arcticus]